MEKERLDDLQLDGLKILQNPQGYNFTSDSVLLANFVQTKHKDICVEVGTGCGIISILVNYKEKPKKIYAFEIQKDVAELAKKNIQLNNIQNIEIIVDNFANSLEYINAGQIDVIFANPPYFKYDKNVSGLNEQKNISRFDKYLKPEDLFCSASKLLKFGGKLYFIYDANRLNEVFNKLKQSNFEPKRMYFVHPNANKNSTIFVCEAVKGAKEGLTIMPPLFTNNLDGDYIQTIQKLYKQKKG